MLSVDFSMEGAALDELAEGLGLFGVDVDEEEVVKVRDLSFRAEAVLFCLEGVVVRLRLEVGGHADEGRQSLQRRRGVPPALLAFFFVLPSFPEFGDGGSSFRVLGVLVEDHGPLGRVEVVAVGPGADPYRDLFSHEHHRQATVVLDVHHEVAPGEAEPRRPERLQHRLLLDHRHRLRLRVVTQVPRRRTAFEVGIAHDGPRPSLGVAVGRDGALDVRQVGGEDRHVVLRGLELADDVVVPAIDEDAVGVDLHRVGFPAVHAIADVARVDGPRRVVRVHFVDFDVTLIFAEGLVGLLGAGNFRLGARHVALAVLLHGGDAYSLRKGRAVQCRRDRVPALEVSVGSDHQKDRRLLPVSQFFCW
mmetsp:Transcript_1468/g.5008  ORF Transcript_1468/g.5008 Transcript_1468/m.5008 type:complete len:362 (-) Transcript_1468:550-1635(-)